MNPTSPIDRSRLSINRTSVGQRLLSSWFRRPAIWSLIFLCTATALVLVVHAAKTENDHLEPSETASRLVDAREVKRINVLAAFFLSIEFQNTGYFVERMYKAGFGDIAPPTVPVPVRFTSFLADSQEIRGNIIVGVGNWQQQIEDAKRAFALTFVQRTEFVNRYPALTSAGAFVDSLNANAGLVLSDSERSALIAELSSNPSAAALRADVLQKVAENEVLQQQEFNRAFVLMQYFGYLRRNPDAAPEANLNFAGYNFWLNKLNQFNGDYVSAERIKAFITSFEYRGRFGP